MKDSDLTIVFQGPVIGGPRGTAECIRLTRRSLPRSRCVLSTWSGADVKGLPVDYIVFSDDPGSLPGIKLKDGPGESNNINRQILSTRQGLRNVETPYAIKIRTDCALTTGVLPARLHRFQGTEEGQRIVTSSLFTIDPMMFEQMPYHLSDWFQLGPTTALRRYWSVPFMTEQDAHFYERHSHAAHSSFMDRRFRCRLAVEQYVATHYAAQFGYSVPTYHNDTSRTVMEGHRRFLGQHCLIMDPWDLGLQFPKYEWAYRSNFQRLNCLLFIDWYDLYRSEGGRPVMGISDRLLTKRRLQKRIARLLGRRMDKAGPILLSPGLKQAVNRILSLLAWPTHQSPWRSPPPDPSLTAQR